MYLEYLLLLGVPADNNTVVGVPTVAGIFAVVGPLLFYVCDVPIVVLFLLLLTTRLKSKSHIFVANVLF